MVSNPFLNFHSDILKENYDVCTSYEVKGYADDITIISTFPKELQEIASHMDNRCKDRPDIVL